MATSKIKGLDEQQLEGGVGGGGGMGRGSSTQIKEVPMDIKGAVEAADKYHAYHYGTKNVNRRAVPRIIKEPEVIDLAKGSKSAKEEAARNKELTASRRQEALSNAKTEGIKTEYPYIEPTERKKGGTVSASRRADGCCVKGKTKGKMI